MKKKFALLGVGGFVAPRHLKAIKENNGELIASCDVVDSVGVIDSFYPDSLFFNNFNGFEKFISEMRDADFLLFEGLDNSKEVRVRRGNIRARLRMNTLYNMAASKKGLVASTDNFSELAAGFWTLHGDVGDIAPIQSLTKSWEVPALAERLGVPQSVIDAVPTDGLGVANGDEDQFGFSYLEFDIALFSLFESKYIKQQLEDDNDANIINEVEKRIRSTIYKRFNPLNLQHPYYTERYSQLEELDNHLDKGD